MATKPTPRTCPECNILPTQHICGSCSQNYVCDLCSQRRGVPEGIFRCKKCAPNASKPSSIDADGNGTTTSRTHSSTITGPINDIEIPIESDGAEEQNHVISKEKESVVAEKRSVDEFDRSSIEFDENGTTTSRTRSSTITGPINDIEIPIESDGPKEQNPTVPEAKESVVTEKCPDNHSTTASGDAVDINTSRSRISANNDATDELVAQVDDADPQLRNHIFLEAEDPVVCEKSDDEQSDDFDTTVKNKPKRFNKKMGKNAIVSVLLKNIIPGTTIRQMYPNNYREKRSNFIVGEIKKKKVKKRNEVDIIIVLTLRFKNPTEDPRYGSSVGFDEVFYWSARYSNCRLEKAGPPNQLFFQTKQSKKPRRKKQSSTGRTRRKRKRNENDENDEESYVDESNHILQTNNDQNNTAELSDQSDPESDIEEIENENSTQKDPNENDRYYVQWEQNFVDNLSIDNRKLRGCTESRATLNGILATNYHFLTASSLFYMLSPTEYFEEHIIPATSKELTRAHEKELTLGEFYCWLGVWFIISLNPGYIPRDFFSHKERNIYWNPPFLGSIMSGKRFTKIGECLRLNNSTPPSYKDRFFWVRELIDGFNDNMKKAFISSWIVCVDESMVVFYNKYAPGWIAVKRKPHPLGNEYHTTACCESKVIFWIEIVEGKSKPKEGPNAESKFEKEFESKIAALVVRMTTPIWGSGKVVIMDSGFGYVPSVVQLKEKGLYATTVIKKKAHWPKYTKAADAVDHMAGKDVGQVRVRNGTYKGGEGSSPISLVALADSLHTSLMLTNWSTTRRDGKPKKRRVGGELVEFQYGEVMNSYYFGRHAVDDNNNNRQGCLSFEEVFQMKDWAMRQFGFIIALCQTNAFLAYNYFKNRKVNEEELDTKATFTRRLAKELIENEMWERQKKDDKESDTNKTKKWKRVEEHELIKMPQYRGKWNGHEFVPVVQKYQKYLCTTPNCRNRVRTYCKCDKSLVLCMECYAIHKNETTWMGESAGDMSPKSDKSTPVASLRPRRICRST